MGGEAYYQNQFETIVEDEDGFEEDYSEDDFT